MAVACSLDPSPQLATTHDAAVPEAVDAGADGAPLPIGSLTRPAFCSREGDDQVRDVFCKGPLPAIGSLRDLQVLLGLRPEHDPPEPIPVQLQPVDSLYMISSIAVLGHSTALSGHLVSTLNPRVIVMGTSTFSAFVRGEQRVELISRARDVQSFNFYLLEFEQACNEAPNGCVPGDLYTPRIESDWLRVQLRDGEELKNTSADCRVCHQRATDTPSLLMRELQSPWTHFFFPAGITPPEVPGVTGSHLMEDYLRAKEGEPYAGFPLHAISSASPFFLETLVGPVQPLLFDAPAIENERFPYGADGYAKEAGGSPTWEAAYAAYKRGEQLALPYLEPRVTDPSKQTALTEAYRRYATNEISAEELPDMSDIYPDDPHERARRGLQTEPDATAEEALIQACGSCHNDVLDRTISRARFNISVSRLDRAALDTAIARIRLPYGAVGAMPPREVRQLDPSARERLLQYLEQEPHLLDPDRRLENAARIGMTRGGGTRGSGIGTL